MTLRPGDQQCCTADEIAEGVHLLDELSKREVRFGERPCRGQSIDHQQRRVALTNDLMHKFQQVGQSGLREGTIPTDIVQRVTDHRGVKEGESVEVGEHASMQLAKEGQIDATPARCDMIERGLVAQDCLARARCALKNIDAATQKAAMQNDIKSEYPRSEEHTSELQSHVYLVCRLLLEKKKTPCAFVTLKPQAGN